MRPKSAIAKSTIVALVLLCMLAITVSAKTVSFRAEKTDPHWEGVSDPAHLLVDKGEYYYVDDYMPYNHPRPAIFLLLPEVKDVQGNLTFTWARVVPGGEHDWGIVSVYASNDSGKTWINIYTPTPRDSFGPSIKKTVTVNIPKGYTFLRVHLSDARASGAAVELWKDMTIETPEQPAVPRIPGLPGFEAVFAVVAIVVAAYVVRHY